MYAMINIQARVFVQYVGFFSTSRQVRLLQKFHQRSYVRNLTDISNAIKIVGENFFS